MGGSYLEFDGISKRFPGVRALDNVSFGVAEGSVHALIGENGAGKSTLLKILSGAYAPDGGEVRLGGRPAAFRSSMDAFAMGVAVIYQELHLVPNMTVAENILLGHYPNRFGWVDKAGLLADTRKQLSILGEHIDPSVKVGSLSIAERQIVEIAKALSRNAKVIAFDEPTSSLSQREVGNLFHIVGELKRQGRVILYVSHRLEEIFQVADSATVLRDGQRVQTFDRLEGVTTDTLVRCMVGRSIKDIYDYHSWPYGEPALKVEGIAGRGLSEPAGLEVREGEIVGIFGLIGAGRTELLKLIYGAVPASAGRIWLKGVPVAIRAPADAIRRGLVFCPEDRKKEGVIPIRSVADNINISVRRLFSWLGFFINEVRERTNAASQIRKLDIRAASARQKIADLSGGNQQKVVLARWLSEDVGVILMDEPTRGIDVGAKSEIYSVIYELAKNGTAILLASSELPEVLGICDRILVMRQGRLVASLDRADATQEKVLSLALPTTQASRPEACPA